MVVVITRYHVGADALPSERGRKGRRQADRTEARMNAQCNALEDVVIGDAMLIGG